MTLKIHGIYIPINKTVTDYGLLDSSNSWRKAKEINQPYLYYNGKDGHGYHCFSVYKRDAPCGDYFNISDVIPYYENFKQYQPCVPNIEATRIYPFADDDAWYMAKKKNQPYLFYNGRFSDKKDNLYAILGLYLKKGEGSLFLFERVCPYTVKYTPDYNLFHNIWINSSDEEKINLEKKFPEIYSVLKMNQLL
jgi:hypothetical protein